MHFFLKLRARSTASLDRLHAPALPRRQGRDLGRASRNPRTARQQRGELVGAVGEAEPRPAAWELLRRQPGPLARSGGPPGRAPPGKPGWMPSAIKRVHAGFVAGPQLRRRAAEKHSRRSIHVFQRTGLFPTHSSFVARAVVGRLSSSRRIALMLGRARWPGCPQSSRNRNACPVPPITPAKPPRGGD